MQEKTSTFKSAPFRLMKGVGEMDQFRDSTFKSTEREYLRLIE